MNTLVPQRLFLLFVLLLPFNIFAQDTIFWKDGHKTIALVIEVTEKVTSYRKTADTSQSEFFIDNRYLEKIQFENGEIKVIPDITDHLYAKPQKKNVIKVNLFDLFVAGSINIRYEYLPGTGRIGLFVDAGVGLTPETYHYHYDNYSNEGHLSVWGIGIMKSVVSFNSGLNLYSPRFGPFSFGSGFSIFMAVYNAEEYNYNTYTYDGGFTKGICRLMWNNQVLINFSDQVGVYAGFDISMISDFFEQNYLHLGLSISF